MNKDSLLLIFFSNVIKAILIGFPVRFSVGFYLFENKKRKNKADQIRDEIEQIFLSFEKKNMDSLSN